MVRVPEYEPNVSLRPAFRQNVDVQASPDAFGASIGRGMQGLAGGLANMGDAVAQVRALEDEAAVRNARNQYIAESDVLKYDPENGFLQKEGKTAIEAALDYEKKVGGLRRKVAASAKLSPTQQRIFQRAVEPLEADSRRQGLMHRAGSLKSYIVNDLKSSVETFANQAMLNANDPALVQKYLAAGQLEIRRQAELQGWGADTLKLREAEYVSGVHKNISLRIAQDDPIAADAYMKSHSGQMTGADQFDLRKSLETEVKTEQSKREADAILGAGRSVSDEGPASTTRTVGQAGPTRSRAFLIAKSNKDASHVDGLDESFADNLAAMMQDAPPDIREGLGIYSGYRSTERQAQLWADALKKYGSPEAARKWVAPPGRSNHNHGQAVDLSYNGQSLARAPQNVVDWVHQNAGKYGLYFPLSNENWHIEPLGTRGTSAVGGTVSPRGNRVASRSAGPSYDDIEAGLAKITDPEVRDLTRKRIAAHLEIQSKADEAREKQAKAELWRYIDEGSTPDQIPMDVRQDAGMAAVSSAWGYIETAAKGRAVESDETLLYDMRRYAASNPTDFANVDLNDYRDRLSKESIKELTGMQTTALTDQRKAREDGLNLTTAFSQAQSQLEAVGITTTGKAGSQREAAAKRIAQFQNALAAEMEAFKQAQNGKAPTQVDIQSMVNRLLLPVVVRTTNPGDLGYGVWPNPLTSLGNLFGSSPDTDALAFEARMRPDGSTVDVPMEYSDIPIDFRRTIASDLERELGRIPARREVVQRYRDFVLDRDPTPIEQVEPTDTRNLLVNRLLRPIAAVPAFALINAGEAVGLMTGTSENSEAGRDRDASLDRFLDGDPLTGGQ